MKIGPKIFDVVLIGYTLERNVNCFLVVNSEMSEISNNIITEVRDVVYFENFFPVKFSVLVILLIILLHLIFTSLVQLQPRIQNQGVKELKILKNFREDFFTYPAEGDLAPLRKQGTPLNLLSGKNPLIVKSNP